MEEGQDNPAFLGENGKTLAVPTRFVFISKIIFPTPLTTISFKAVIVILMYFYYLCVNLFPRLTTSRKCFFYILSLFLVRFSPFARRLGQTIYKIY